MDNGEIFQYLSDLDNRVFDALDSQEELLKANSREFQEAHEKGDIVTEGAIGNLLQQQARESVFEAMIYCVRCGHVLCELLQRDTRRQGLLQASGHKPELLQPLTCLNDWLIYAHAVTLETSEGEERVEVNK